MPLLNIYMGNELDDWSGKKTIKTGQQARSFLTTTSSIGSDKALPSSPVQVVLDAHSVSRKESLESSDSGSSAEPSSDENSTAVVNEGRFMVKEDRFMDQIDPSDSDDSVDHLDDYSIEGYGGSGCMECHGIDSIVKDVPDAIDTEVNDYWKRVKANRKRSLTRKQSNHSLSNIKNLTEENDYTQIEVVHDENLWLQPDSDHCLEKPENTKSPSFLRMVKSMSKSQRALRPNSPLGFELTLQDEPDSPNANLDDNHKSKLLHLVKMLSKTKLASKEENVLPLDHGSSCESSTDWDSEDRYKMPDETDSSGSGAQEEVQEREDEAVEAEEFRSEHNQDAQDLEDLGDPSRTNTSRAKKILRASIKSGASAKRAIKKGASLSRKAVLSHLASGPRVQDEAQEEEDEENKEGQSEEHWEEQCSEDAQGLEDLDDSNGTASLRPPGSKAQQMLRASMKSGAAAKRALKKGASLSRKAVMSHLGSGSGAQNEAQQDQLVPVSDLQNEVEDKGDEGNDGDNESPWTEQCHEDAQDFEDYDNVNHTSSSRSGSKAKQMLRASIKSGAAAKRAIQKSASLSRKALLSHLAPDTKVQDGEGIKEIKAGDNEEPWVEESNENSKEFEEFGAPNFTAIPPPSGSKTKKILRASIKSGAAAKSAIKKSASVSRKSVSRIAKSMRKITLEDTSDRSQASKSASVDANEDKRKSMLRRASHSIRMRHLGKGIKHGVSRLKRMGKNGEAVSEPNLVVCFDEQGDIFSEKTERSTPESTGTRQSETEPSKESQSDSSVMSGIASGDDSDSCDGRATANGGGPEVVLEMRRWRADETPAAQSDLRDPCAFKEDDNSICSSIASEEQADERENTGWFLEMGNRIETGPGKGPRTAGSRRSIEDDLSRLGVEALFEGLFDAGEASSVSSSSSATSSSSESSNGDLNTLNSTSTQDDDSIVYELFPTNSFTSLTGIKCHEGCTSASLRQRSPSGTKSMETTNVLVRGRSRIRSQGRHRSTVIEGSSKHGSKSSFGFNGDKKRDRCMQNGGDEDSIIECIADEPRRTLSHKVRDALFL